MLELTIRLVFSLAIVLGLLLLLAKLGARRFQGGKDSMVRVLHRQQVSRGAAVSVVSVGSRVLVLGTTEQQVSVLAELDPEEVLEDANGEVLELVQVDDAEQETFVLPAATTVVKPVGSHRGARRATKPAAKPALKPAKPTTKPTTVPAPVGRRASRPATDGPLTGSVLSADTWRQALAAATRRAS